MNDASLVEQYKSLFRHAALPQHSYEEYQATIAQTGNVYFSDLALGVFGGVKRPQTHQISLARGTGARSEYLQLLSDYLERIPDDAVGIRTIAVGQLMIEIQGLLL